MGLAACGSRPPGDASTRAAVLVDEGENVAAAGDFARAIVLYEVALRLDPTSLRGRFALGAALSQLERVEATAEQFRWVVQHGAPGRPEVRIARQWLATAAGLAPRVVARAPAPPPAVASPPVPEPKGGIVRGRTEWPDLPPDRYQLTLQILLIGDDPDTRGHLVGGRTRLGEAFVIRNVPEGAWRLTAQVGMVRLWDTRVDVRAGRPTVVDLTPEGALISPTEFPQR